MWSRRMANTKQRQTKTILNCHSPELTRYGLAHVEKGIATVAVVVRIEQLPVEKSTVLTNLWFNFKITVLCTSLNQNTTVLK